MAASLFFFFRMSRMAGTEERIAVRQKRIGSLDETAFVVNPTVRMTDDFALHQHEGAVSAVKIIGGLAA